MRTEDKSDPLFDLASFLANSARGSLEEGILTASLRLVDALARLPLACSGPDNKKDEFLLGISSFINERMTQEFLLSRERYVEFLDEIVRRFAKEIARRNGLETT